MQFGKRLRPRIAKGSSAIFAALFVTSLCAPASLAQSIDTMTTGSITPAERPNDGSGAFRSALALLKQGHPMQAYQAARGLSDTVERRTIQWAAIYYGAGEIDYDTVVRFQADAPNFASATLYKTRLEQSLTKDLPGKDKVIALLGGQMPITIDAQIALAEAYVLDGQTARAGRIARSIWVDNYLNKDQEAEVLSKLGNLLTNKDHWDRAVHLLMHDRATGTERIMDRLTPAQQSLAKARIAVARKSSNAKALIDRVDPSLRTHPLFYFNLAQYAHDNGHLAQAVKYLNMVTTDVPDSDQFWYERRNIVREAIRVDDYKTAYAAAAGYVAGPEGRLVDAHFHAGWVALEYLHDAQTARDQFLKMKALSTIPTSVSKVNYWLGRAYSELGEETAARAAFKTAADHNTLYYGQLARERLGEAAVTIRDLPAYKDREPMFEQNELVRAVRLLAANGQETMAEPLVRRLGYSLTNGGDLLLAARLAQDIDAHNVAILIAGIAEDHGIALDLFNFPKDGLPTQGRLAQIDTAAIYAIARQESHFDANAVSHAGARGLMQLMPATAKETAHKVGVSYSLDRLTSDPAYNALLGSSYLSYQLERYDGSLVLAAAAYNAGAGNVNKWLKIFGDPRSTHIDPVNWVERIPFTETRNYVQRVLGNYMVYRTRQGDTSTKLSAALRHIGK